MVTRQVYPTVPPQVEYGLTALGHPLSVPVMHLATWCWSISTRSKVTATITTAVGPNRRGWSQFVTDSFRTACSATHPFRPSTVYECTT